MDVYTFFSVLAHGTSNDLMFYMYAGFVHLMTKASMRIGWSVLTWSFAALATGKWPERDHLGNLYPPGSLQQKRANTWFAGGFRAVVWCIAGDLDYYAKNLWLRHCSSAHPCNRCPANNLAGDPCAGRSSGEIKQNGREKLRRMQGGGWPIRTSILCSVLVELVYRIFFPI